MTFSRAAMKSGSMAFVGLAALFIAASAASPVAAQTSGSSGPAFGPALPGICLLAKKEALTASAASRAIEARIAAAERALATAAAQQEAGFTARRGQLAMLQGKLAPADYARRMADIDTDQRTAAATRNRQTALIASEAAKARASREQRLAQALTSVVTAKKCSLIVERDATYGWNNAMDITPDVMRAMQ